jgi:hypothetical protein
LLCHISVVQNSILSRGRLPQARLVTYLIRVWSAWGWGGLSAASIAAGLVEDPDDLLPGVTVEPGAVAGVRREAVACR